MPRDEEAFPKVFLRIKELWRSGKFTFSDHGGKRVDERDIGTPELAQLIKFGRMVECRHDLRHANPSYAIEGLSPDGMRMRCVVVIDDDLLIIVTAFRRN